MLHCSRYPKNDFFKKAGAMADCAFFLKMVREPHSPHAEEKPDQIHAELHVHGRKSITGCVE